MCVWRVQLLCYAVMPELLADRHSINWNLGVTAPRFFSLISRHTSSSHLPGTSHTRASHFTQHHQQERESFSQLAAEASAPTGGPGATANGTPSCVTPVGSVGGAPAPIYGLPAALSSLSLGPSALITRNSSVDLTGGSGLCLC